MTAPRWRKIFKDLVSNKTRTLLVMITIAVSAIAVGFVSTTYVRVLGDMDADFQSANPHGAIIYTSNFNDDFLHSLAKVPGVSAVEGRSQIAGFILMPDGRRIQITITALPPLSSMQIDTLKPYVSGGIIAVGDHELLLDGSAKNSVQLSGNEILTIDMGNGLIRQLKVNGFVHDVTAFPYMFTNSVTAYTTPKTMEWLGGNPDFNQVYLTVLEQKTNEAHVKRIAQSVADKIEQSGRPVFVTLVYQPGKHFAATIVQVLVLMMGALGLLAVLLSAILVINTVDALLSQQVRQIGVMKAIGANTLQIVGMYLLLVTFYGLLALLVAVPAAAFLANIISDGFSEFLNYRPRGFLLPTSTIVLQVIVGVIIPVLATLVPVLRSSRTTVREAISNYGIGGGKFGHSWFDRLLERVRGLPRPLLISLRNTFRRKGRLFRTLLALVLAGAIFIAVFNLRASMNKTIDDTLGYFLSDVNVGFDRMYRMERIDPLAMNVPGVERVEGWASTFADIPNPDGQASIQVLVTAPPANSTLIKPTLTSGRWLLPEDENAVVIGNHVLAVRPDLKIGDEITLDIDEQESEWMIVGIFQLAGNSPFPYVFVNYNHLMRVLGESNQIAEIRVVTSQHDAAFQDRVSKQLEQVFKDNGIVVSQAITGADVTSQNTSQTDILINFLILMAVFIAVVGGFGLATTMSLNVIERVREIGVMRAVGASNRSIQQLVIFEGILIGIISWITGAALAIPIGMFLAYAVGVTMVQSPLTFVFSWDGFLVWLLLVAIISSVASFLPARNASRLTVREVLSYE